MGKAELIKARYNVARIIGFVIIQAFFFYWVIARFVVKPSFDSSQNLQVLRLIFYFLAAGGFLGIFFLKRIMLQKTPQDDLETLLKKLMTSNIAVFAVCEAPALYGLVLRFIGGPISDFYILTTYSLLLMTIFFPRLSQWEEYTAGVNS